LSIEVLKTAVALLCTGVDYKLRTSTKHLITLASSGWKPPTRTGAKWRVLCH